MVRLVDTPDESERAAAFEALSDDDRARFLATVGLEQLQTVDDNVIVLRAWCETLERIGDSEAGEISTLSISLIVDQMLMAFEDLDAPLRNLILHQQDVVAELAGQPSIKVVK